MLIKIGAADSNCFTFILYLLVGSEVDVFKVQKNLLPLQGETGTWGLQLFSPLCTAHKFPSLLSWSATTQSSHHSLNSEYTKDGTQGVPLERLGSNCTNQTLPSSVRVWDLSVTSSCTGIIVDGCPKYPKYIDELWRVILCSLDVQRPLSPLVGSYKGICPRLWFYQCTGKEQSVSCHHTFCSSRLSFNIS